MKAKEFKQFKEIISTCEDDHPIWWEGYLYLQLTEKQFNETREILRDRYGVVIDYKGFIEREIRKEVKRWCIDNSFGWFDYEIGALIPESVRPYRIRYTVIVRFSGEQISIDDNADVSVREEVEYKRLHVTWVASQIRVREVTEE